MASLVRSSQFFFFTPKLIGSRFRVQGLQLMHIVHKFDLDQ